MSSGRRRAPRPRRSPAAARTAPTKGALRIVSGSAGGRRIDVPAGSSTRPTSDRVREAVFNALDSLDAVDEAQVLDAFAGSGALGIEALSRGAAHATFTDSDPQAVAVVDANLKTLGLASRATVLTRTAERALGAGGTFDLVLLDPPYSFETWTELFAALEPRVASGAVLVVESDAEIALPPWLTGIRTKTYGGTVVQFATPTGAPS